MTMIATSLILIAGVSSAQLPSRQDVEGAMFLEDTRWCRDLIDHCLDENGNDIYPEPSFEVSRLKCRPLAETRAACSFTSVRSAGSQIGLPRHCEATLRGHRSDDGQLSWSFAARPRSERSTGPRYRPLLKCN